MQDLIRGDALGFLLQGVARVDLGGVGSLEMVRHRPPHGVQFHAHFDDAAVVQTLIQPRVQTVHGQNLQGKIPSVARRGALDFFHNGLAVAHKGFHQQFLHTHKRQMARGFTHPAPRPFVKTIFDQIVGFLIQLAPAPALHV